MSVAKVVDVTAAITDFSRIAADVNRTGIPVTVFKNDKPWVEIRSPTATETPTETLQAMAEVEQIKKNSDHQRFATAEELFSSLGI